MRTITTALLLLAPLTLTVGSPAEAQRAPTTGLHLAAAPALSAALQRGRMRSSSAGRSSARSSGFRSGRSSSAGRGFSRGSSRSGVSSHRSSGYRSSRSSHSSRSVGRSHSSGRSSRSTTTRSSHGRSSSAGRSTGGTTRVSGTTLRTGTSYRTDTSSHGASRSTTTSPRTSLGGSSYRTDSARTPSAGFGSSSSSSPVIDLRPAASPGRVRFPAPYRPTSVSTTSGWTGTTGGARTWIGTAGRPTSIAPRQASGSGARLIDRYRTAPRPTRSSGSVTGSGGSAQGIDGLRTDRYTRGTTSGGRGVEVGRTRSSGRPTRYGGSTGGPTDGGGTAGGLTLGGSGRTGTTSSPSGAIARGIEPVAGGRGSSGSGRGPGSGRGIGVGEGPATLAGAQRIAPSRGRGNNGLPTAGSSIRPTYGGRPKPTYGGGGAIRPSHNRGWAFSSFGYLDGYGYGYGHWYPWLGRYAYGYWSWLDCWWYPFHYGLWFGAYYGYGYPAYYGPTFYSNDGYYDDDDDTNITIVIEDDDDDQPVQVIEAAPEPVGEAVVGVAAAPGAKTRATSRYASSAAESYVRLGDQAFRERRYTDAVQLYAKAVEFQPDQGDLYLILADALFAAGDYHYAAYAIRRALELEPVLAESDVDKHGFYDDPSLFDHQLSVLENYVQDHPTDHDARLVLALNYLFSSSPERAVAALDPGKEGQPASDPAAERVLASARARLAAR